MTFTEAERLNLADVQDHKAVYNFIQATKSVDSAYVNEYQIHVDACIQRGIEISTFYDAVKGFRNNLCLKLCSPEISFIRIVCNISGQVVS